MQMASGLSKQYQAGCEAGRGCVSNLRSYIDAVGSRLKIEPETPEGEVAITDFSDVGW